MQLKVDQIITAPFGMKLVAKDPPSSRGAEQSISNENGHSKGEAIEIDYRQIERFRHVYLDSEIRNAHIGSGSSRRSVEKA